MISFSPIVLLSPFKSYSVCQRGAERNAVTVGRIVIVSVTVVVHVAELSRVVGVRVNTTDSSQPLRASFYILPCLF